MKIIDIQRYLADLGFAPGPIDGLYGRKTRAGIHAAFADYPDQVAGGWQGWDKDRLLIAAEQAIMHGYGVDTGPIDGLLGPQTEHGRIVFSAGNWRDALIKPEPGDARMPEPVKTVWPRQPDCERHYGPVGQNQAMLDLPFSMKLAWDTDTIVGRFSIHEKVHDSAARVFARIHDHYGDAEIARLGLDLFGGCLNVRRMRGGSAWSMHAWGIAIDFDPAHNRLNWDRDRARLAGPDYDAFWRFWTEEGWLSLGKARDFDWMHVQAARL